MRKVYLGKLDIAPDGELELRSRGVPFSEKQVLRYLFMYGLVCDQVLLQGSSPLKSKKIFQAYLSLSEAFRRNGLNTSDPIYSFVQSDESYVDYYLNRNSLLRGVNAHNAEKRAYALNHAFDISKKLDRDLYGAQIVKRVKSVPRLFRSGLLSNLRDLEKADFLQSKGVASLAIAKINNTEFLQTFELMTSLSLIDRQEYYALYKLIRNCYRKANALGVDSVDAEEIAVYGVQNIEQFLRAIGLSELLTRTEILKWHLLFQIKALDSYDALLSEYIKCETNEQMQQFFSLLNNASIKRSLSATARHSIGTLITSGSELMEYLGTPKIVTKPIEFFGKGVLGDAADRNINKRLAKISDHLEEFNRDIKDLKY